MYHSNHCGVRVRVRVRVEFEGVKQYICQSVQRKQRNKKMLYFLDS